MVDSRLAAVAGAVKEATENPGMLDMTRRVARIAGSGAANLLLLTSIECSVLEKTI